MCREILVLEETKHEQQKRSLNFISALWKDTSKKLLKEFKIIHGTVVVKMLTSMQLTWNILKIKDTND